MSETARPGDTGSSGTAAAVDTSGMVPRWAALTQRYATAAGVAADAQALASVEDHRAVAHEYLIGGLLELGETHADCALLDCPTCRSLARAVSMVLAESEIRQGRVSDADAASRR